MGPGMDPRAQLMALQNMRRGGAVASAPMEGVPSGAELERLRASGQGLPPPQRRNGPPRSEGVLSAEELERMRLMLERQGGGY